MPTLFEDFMLFQHEANVRVLDAIADMPEGTVLPDRVMLLMSHILNAHQIWLDRAKGQPIRTEVWAVYDLETCRQLNEHQVMESLAYLQSIADPTLYNKPLAYTTTTGGHYESILRDILLHIVNHGTYHRGQIVQTLVQYGGKAPSTDYIFLQREKQKQEHA